MEPSGEIGRLMEHSSLAIRLLVIRLLPLTLSSQLVDDRLSKNCPSQEYHTR